MAWNGYNQAPTTQFYGAQQPAAYPVATVAAGYAPYGPPAPTGYGQQNMPTAANYVTLSQREHVLQAPDVYVGSEHPMDRKLWAFDCYNQQKMVFGTIHMPPAMEACYREIIANATDNCSRTRRNGRDPGRIEVTMNNTTITVKNYGDMIPLDWVDSKTPEERALDPHGTDGYMWLPQKIFGTMLTGSNFVNNGERHDAGKNGIGAKATNIFSSVFSIEICNAEPRYRGCYRQTWRNNMSICEPAVIIAYNEPYSSCTVTFTLDFNFFKYVPEYTEEFYMLYMRHAMDASFNTEVPVSFNGQLFNFCNDNFKEFGRLYFGDAVEDAFIHFEYTGQEQVYAAGGYGVAAAAPVKKRRGKNQIAAAEAVEALVSAAGGQSVCRVKLLVCDTPTVGKMVSYVNCIMTNDGGTHVDAAVEAFAGPILERVNRSYLDGKSSSKAPKKGKKGKKAAAATPVKTLTAAEKRTHTIHAAEVLKHTSFLVSVRVINPRFDSQTKTKLTFPPVSVTINPDQLEIIRQWDLNAQLTRELKLLHIRAADGKAGGGSHSTGKGVHANKAKKAGKEHCVLIIMEGKTGKGYSTAAITNRGIRDVAGELPLRGKIPTASKSEFTKIAENKELASLYNMLGLKWETDYLIPENFATLNYGAGLLIMTDADGDGWHIGGLVMDYFMCYFPSLLQRGYLMYWSSPLVSVRKGKSAIIHFYNMDELRAWQASTPDYNNKKVWTYKYYKGLGTSDSSDVGQQMRAPRVIHCVYDANTPIAVQLAFDPKLVEARKQWLMNCVPEEGVDHVVYQTIEQMQNDRSLAREQQYIMQNASALMGHSLFRSECYTDFFNDKFINFSLLTLTRAIPADSDGLKTSQRKIIYTCYKHWISQASTKGVYKVAQLGGMVSDKTHYPHGEKNLEDTIVKLARIYTGSNNCNLLYPSGQFGNNMDASDGASPARYIFTRPTGFFYKLFHKDDLPLLSPIIEQGDEIEPHRYYPILPLHMLNGFRGVATGYATRGPPFNPLDVAAWFQQRLIGVPPDQIPDIIPWFRYFRGHVTLIDRRLKQGNRVKMTRIVGGQLQTGYFDDTGLDMPDDEGIRHTHSLTTYGNYYYDHAKRRIVVDALPIGISGTEYKCFLEGLKGDKIKDFELQSEEIRPQGKGKNDVCKVRDQHTFYIEGYTGRDDPKELGLVTTFSMTNMILLNEKNIPIRYDNPRDLLESFLIERKPWYGKRKDHLIKVMAEEINKLTNRQRFIQAVVDEKIEVTRRTSAARVISQMVSVLQFSQELAAELHKKVRIVELCQEKCDELARQIDKINQEYEILRAKPIEQMWYEDIEEFRQYIVKNPRRLADYSYGRQIHGQTQTNLSNHVGWNPATNFPQGINLGTGQPTDWQGQSGNASIWRADSAVVGWSAPTATATNAWGGVEMKTVASAINLVPSTPTNWLDQANAKAVDIAAAISILPPAVAVVTDWQSALTTTIKQASGETDWFDSTATVPTVGVADIQQAVTSWQA